MMKSATNWRDLSSLIQDGRAGHLVDPELFATFTMNHQVELDACAGVPENTSISEPDNQKLQEYLRRSLRVIEELMWIGFDPARALFWFRSFPISELDNKSPMLLLADGNQDLIIERLNATFRSHNEPLSNHWERMRENTIRLQEDLVRRVPMSTAFQMARTCAPHRILDSEFLVARDLAKAREMFYVMWHRKPLFPKYQFDVEGRPRPIIEKILLLLSPYRSRWDIALWCSASNGWLGGRRPEELLEIEPASVLRAAEQDVAEIADL
jgi:hypothetical protein